MAIKVGIVGIGGICRSEHLPALKKNPNVEIIALCDINPNKLEGANALVGHSVKTYTDYREMIEKEPIELVHICTPNYLHSEIAVFALEHDKNVFSEKPDAVGVEEVLKMQRAADEAFARSGKRLMCMRNNRHLTTSEHLKAMVDAGDFGEIYTGRCGWIRRRGIPGRGGWFTTKAESGGGPLIDLGVHMIDLAVYLMGNPRAVSVSGSIYNKFADNYEKSDSSHATFGEAKADGIFDVEDLAIGFIKFENGASLQIEFSWASNIEHEKNFVELRGTKLGCTWQNGTYELFNGKNPPCKFKRARAKVSQLASNRIGGHEKNIAHFIDVLMGKAQPDYEIAQGVNMIKILTAIYESAATGHEVTL